MEDMNNYGKTESQNGEEKCRGRQEEAGCGMLMAKKKH